MFKRAMEETGNSCEIVTWSDYPSAAQCERIPNPDKALLLGAWAERTFAFDIAVADGYWGAGILSHPVVPVVHGTWAAFSVAMGMQPRTNPEVWAQHAAFTAMNAYPVAVSLAAARELVKWHKRKAVAVIGNAVDLEEFTPQKVGRLDTPPIVLHAATNAKKGAELMPAIARELGPEFQVLPLAARAGEEARAMQRGDIFLHPSKHEGGSYALLEAAAVGLPIVTTNVGQFQDVEDGLVGRVLPVSTTVAQWAAAIREVWGDGFTPYRKYARNARRFARQHADFETFKAEWMAVLTAILKG